MRDVIISKLSDRFPIIALDVIDESHMHNTPPGSESHFKVVIVSDLFKGKLPVKRHQLIYNVLADEMRDNIHALALHTYTADEWQSRAEVAPDSPDCQGGSKK
ncbi:MAG: BolA family protein [Endozoicomonas sp.]